MARRRKHEEHENHERWLISYADFITLLFAFFVVMYSISSVNEGKYRVLSDALMSAFRQAPKSMEPIQIGRQTKSEVAPNMNFVQRPNVLDTPAIAVHPPDQGEQRGADGEHLMRQIADRLTHALGDLVDQGLISVRHNELWLEVEIKDSVLFPSGSAALQPGALPVLHAVARVLKDFPNSVRVEGFTDDMPINTLLYPSNWELSTGRASSVVRLLAREGIAPVRMSALGYAEFRPVAGNDTAEGRARNRRVVLVVLADDRLANVFDARSSGAAPVPDQAPADPHAVEQGPAGSGSSSGSSSGSGVDTTAPRSDAAPLAALVPRSRPAAGPDWGSGVDAGTAADEGGEPNPRVLSRAAAAAAGFAPHLRPGLAAPVEIAPASPMRLPSPLSAAASGAEGEPAAP
jgi:chemotaxis protein MotB